MSTRSKVCEKHWRSKTFDWEDILNHNQKFFLQSFISPTIEQIQFFFISPILKIIFSFLKIKKDTFTCTKSSSNEDKSIVGSPTRFYWVYRRLVGYINNLNEFLETIVEVNECVNCFIRSAKEYSFVNLVLIEMVLTLTAMKIKKSFKISNRRKSWNFKVFLNQLLI